VLVGLFRRQFTIQEVVDAIRYGRVANRLIDWDIESDWTTPLDDVRQKLGIVPFKEKF
jgi:ubiquinone biosynthesis protein Coq4